MLRINENYHSKKLYKAFLLKVYLPVKINVIINEVYQYNNGEQFKLLKGQFSVLTT